MRISLLFYQKQQSRNEVIDITRGGNLLVLCCKHRISYYSDLEISVVPSDDTVINEVLWSSRKGILQNQFCHATCGVAKLLTAINIHQMKVL